MLETLTDAEYNKCKFKKKEEGRKKEMCLLCVLIFLFFFFVRENSLFVKYLNYVLLLVVMDTIVISQSLKRISSLSLVYVSSRSISTLNIYVKYQKFFALI